MRVWYKVGVPQNTPQTNGWRIFDSYGEHVATVYEESMRDMYLQRPGYTAEAVKTNDPRW